MEHDPGAGSFRDCLALIKSDYATQYSGGLAGFLARYILDAGLFATVNYRIAHWLDLKGWVRPAWLLDRVSSRLSDIWLVHTARFGPGLSLHHGHGTKIGNNVIAGKHCIVHHNCLLTKNLGRTRIDENGEEYDEPRLGDYTHLLPGAYVLGPVNIGSHVVIGPQTIVTEDVPDYSLVFQERSLSIRPIDPTSPKDLVRFATVLPQAWDEEWQRVFGWTGDESTKGSAPEA